eukprot:UN21918
MNHTLVKYIKKESELEYIPNIPQHFHLLISYKEILIETTTCFYFTLMDKLNIQ